MTRPEISRIAEFLKTSEGELRRDYLKRVGLRTTIIEHGATKDCIFLRQRAGEKRCLIYEVRPSQCRSWPFWPENLAGISAWNKAARKCPGINRGRLYTFEEIQMLRKFKKWWLNTG